MLPAVLVVIESRNTEAVTAESSIELGLSGYVFKLSVAEVAVLGGVASGGAELGDPAEQRPRVDGPVVVPQDGVGIPGLRA